MSNTNGAYIPAREIQAMIGRAQSRLGEVAELLGENHGIFILRHHMNYLVDQLRAQQLLPKGLPGEAPVSKRDLANSLAIIVASADFSLEKTPGHYDLLSLGLVLKPLLEELGIKQQYGQHQSQMKSERLEILENRGRGC